MAEQNSVQTESRPNTLPSRVTTVEQNSVQAESHPNTLPQQKVCSGIEQKNSSPFWGPQTKKILVSSDGNHSADSPKSNAIVSSGPKMMSLWKRAIESSKALLLDEICLGPNALLKNTEEFESSSQATAQAAAAAATITLPGLTSEQMQCLVTFWNPLHRVHTLVATDTNCFMAFSHDICVLQDRTSKSPIGHDVKFEETVFPFTTPLGPSPTPETTTFYPARNSTKHPMASPPVIGETHHQRQGEICYLIGCHFFLWSVGYHCGSWPQDLFSGFSTELSYCSVSHFWLWKATKEAPSILKDYSHADHTLFTYRKRDVFLSVLVYVDDLILAGNNSTPCSSFKLYLNDCFKLKDLGPLKYFLGIEAARGPRGLFLSQCKYALDILSESCLSASKPVAFPMEQNHSLALANGPLLSDPGPYRRLIGRLVYLTITRPDICNAVHVLSQFMQSPRSQHWDAALRVLLYFKAVPLQGLFLPADCPLQIYAFCD
ncbi:hypothetical protein RJ639_032603 [Escallonia herrerae]|uniref:Reverse transcriptase Ty1/copia-type domain-containing protein n=1 Tax=Escallonia herrerae TaxID=1293975 RepID=A0AA89BKH3_9ASTE|nr:hypothetical protein RJ639_032603 [Escallonia herrerae]